MTLRRALARLEIWDKLPYDGGARLAFTSKVISAVSSYSLEGDEQFRFSIPSSSRAAAHISDLRVVRVWRADDDYTHWLIAPQQTTRSRGGTLTVTCWPVSYLLSIRGEVPEWQVSDPKGKPILDVTVTGTITEILQTYLIDNTRINGVMPYLALGTIEPTTEVTVSWKNASRRAVINACLDALAAKGQLAEFRARETTSNLLIDVLTEVGSSAPLLNLRIKRNLTSLTRAIDPTDRWTRLQPVTADLGGDGTFLGASRWKVTNNASGVLTLADPAGGAGPVGFDNQFNATGTYYLYREKTAKAYQITDSALSPNTVTISGDPGIAVGEYVQFRTAVTSGTPIAVGPVGSMSSLSRGYVLPLLAVGKSTNVLTIAAGQSQPTADNQYAGDDVAFSNFVQTSVATLTPHTNQPPYGWPSYTLVWESGTDFSTLAADDWCVTGALSNWEGSGGSGYSVPPMTITAVTDSTHLEVTLRGDGPVFNSGTIPSITLQVFRPVAANLTGTVTASSASAKTVTVDDATGITATTSAPCALELSYTPALGEQPYYLDHPDYAVETPPGIGIKAGTFDRGELVSVANLCPNALVRNWTSGLPTGYTVAGSGATVTEITDPLYTPISDRSAKVTGATIFRTPTIDWVPAYVGQRFSMRAKLFIVSSGWSGGRTFAMRPGYVTADGGVYYFGLTDPVLMMVPPGTAGTLPSGWEKPAGGAWFDAVIPGFDITATSDLGGGSEASQATLANAVGYFVALTSTGGAVMPDFYFGGIAITATDVAVPDGKITEFGEANTAHQDTNTALGILAVKQESVTVDMVDLARLNKLDPSLRVTLGGPALVNDVDLSLLNQRWRIVEIPELDELYPAKTRITLAARTKRFTDLFLKRVTGISGSSSSSTSQLQSGGNGTTTVGGTPGTGGTGGTGSSGDGAPAPAISIAIAVDSSNVPTATAVGNSVVTRVKLAGRTDRFPTADDVRAEASDDTAPFTATFSALSAGQTLFVAGFGYDSANNESAFAAASYTLSATNVASDLAAHYIASAGITEVAGAVADWADQTSNARDLDDNGSTDPVKVANILNGQPVVRYDSNDETWTTTPVLPRPNDCTLFAVVAPGATLNGQIAIGIGDATDVGLQLGAGTTNNRIGGCIDTAGWSTCNESFSGTGVGDVIFLRRSGTTVTFFKNGVACTPTFTSNPLGPGSTYKIGIGRRITAAPDASWVGDVAEGGVYTRALSDAEIAAKSAELASTYDIGGAGTPSAPTLTYQYSGGDVIVTATSALADSVKMDASTSATPSDATVRATTAIATLPFSKTLPAPTGAQVLHVKAFAYIGTNESASATVDIPAESGSAPDDPEYLVGASSASLTNERVVTDTTTVAWNLATAGQAKANVPDGSLGVAKVSATGTPSSTTFWRGDNTWATPAGTTVHSIGAGFDGSGAALALTGTIKVRVGPVQFSGTIGLSSIVLDQSGAVTIGVKKCARTSYPGSLADITGGNDVTISAAAQGEDSTLTGWTTSVSVDDVFEFELKAVDGTVEQATVLLKVS